jgi:hypothetical protein
MPFLERLTPRRWGIEVPGWGEKIFSKKKRNEYYFHETRIFNEASFIIKMLPGHKMFRSLFVFQKRIGKSSAT